MLQFYPVTLEDREWMTAYYRKKNYMGAQYSFAANFVWQPGYGIEVCRQAGVVYLRFRPTAESGPHYRGPTDEDGRPSADGLRELEAFCRAQGQPLRLYSLPEADCLFLEQTCPGRFAFTLLRDDCEYIYSQAQLATLAGKKLHAKRNFIHRFTEQPWRYESVTPGQVETCWQLHLEWCRRYGCGNGDGSGTLCAEKQAVRRCFDHWQLLGLCGGLLYQHDRPVAYTVGERVGGDTFAVHFEKALADVAGAYPAINQQFVLHEAEGCLFVNREEDMGDEGLRRAKLSYVPLRLLPVYRAEERHV